MRLLRATFLFAILVLEASPATVSSPGKLGTVDWPVYRGDSKANQFAALAQINATNVHKLQRAWEYHTGDASDRSTMSVNPIVIDGVMYISTPGSKAVALDAATGARKWSFDPAIYNQGAVLRLHNRGVTYWKGAEGERIFVFAGERVYAVDAKSGALLRSFGNGGHIDLQENLGVDPAGVKLEMTSPGAVYKNLLILGSPAHIRAYDTVNGQLKWTFHTIPQPGEFGYDTWNGPKGETFGGAYAAGGITVDEKRGLVFAATGSATDAFYGGFRKGKNLFANAVVALNATTGERKWHYQTVRHDIWNYDNPAAPILVTIGKNNTSRDAVVQLTKMGLVFVLDRDTGEPIFPVQDLPVPPSDVPGEEVWPTQPFPLRPMPLVRQSVSEADLTNITPQAHQSALEQFRRYRPGSIYTPPSLQGTITMPGHLGGAQWHGGSFDPQLNVLYVNVNEIPTINLLRPVFGNDAAARRYSGVGDIQFTDSEGFPGIAPPWGTLNAIDLSNGQILWKVPLGEYPALAARGIHHTGTMNFGGTVATAGGVAFVAATADAKIRAFETHSGRVLWEYQLPVGGYATPSVYAVNDRQYVAIAAGGGKNATKSGDSIVAFALPNEPDDHNTTSDSDWIQLFDGKTLNGWVHMNGAHTFDVEDGAIVGRTVEGSQNSFLCSLKEFDDFDFELETYIDPITNSGVQFRTQVRPVSSPGPISIMGAGRINGPQAEIRRSYKGLPATGMLYGEALNTGWFTPREKIEQGHPWYVNDGWNTLRIVARGPRIQTFVNGHPVEDQILEDLYRTYKKGFIGLQIHSVSQREIDLPVHAGLGITTRQPLMVKFRNIRIRPLH